MTVTSSADCGDWLKVKIHTKTDKMKRGDFAGETWGWTLRRYKGQEFLVPASGVIIDDLKEAMKLNERYNTEVHKDIERTATGKKLANKNSQEKTSAETPQNSEPPSKPVKVFPFSPKVYGKENQTDSLSKEMPPLSPAPSSGPSSVESAAFLVRPELMKSNSIRLPPLDSPTVPLEGQSRGEGRSSGRSSKSTSKKEKGKTNKGKLVQGVPSEPLQEGAVEQSQVDGLNTPVWAELKDSSGHLYYYNSETKESKWEPPEWIQVPFFYSIFPICAT